MQGPGRRWHSRRRKLDPATLEKIRFGLFQAIILLLFAVLVAQLWRLQILQGRYYQQRAEVNRLRVASVPAPRGVMYDRNGVQLVRNVPTFTISIIPADLPTQAEALAALYAELEKLLQVPAVEIGAKVGERIRQGHLFQPVPIKIKAERETAFIVEEARPQLPGVLVQIEPVREYPYGDLVAHLLGYVGRIDPQEYEALASKGYTLNDKLGKTGVELTYESLLRGRPGQETVETDARGRKLASLYRTEPETGKNLILTVDLELQRQMRKALEQTMGRSQYAATVAMNPKTGEILGMVSLPSYDNNLFSRPVSQEELAKLLEDPRRPLVNHAVSSASPPGSIFKLVTGAGALAEGVAAAGTRIVSTGQISVVSQFDPDTVYVFRDWAPLGALDFRRAIALSSDVYFYYLAGGYETFQGLGVERLAKHARAFGLGEPTGIDLPGEAPGVVPDPRWKRQHFQEIWLKGDSYNMGIGQGFVTTTPLQMLNVVATISNGGLLWEPKIVREVVDSQGRVVVPFTRRTIRQVPVRDEHLRLIREGMREGVAWGTARGGQVPGVVIGGKTGTAEFGRPDPVLGYAPTTHGWFLAFAPYEDPEIALVVFHQVGQGALTAAPAASQILRYYFSRQAVVQGAPGGPLLRPPG